VLPAKSLCAMQCSMKWVSLQGQQQESNAACTMERLLRGQVLCISVGSYVLTVVLTGQMASSTCLPCGGCEVVTVEWKSRRLYHQSM
jgi:hypothetical protein